MVMPFATYSNPDQEDWWGISGSTNLVSPGFTVTLSPDEMWMAVCEEEINRYVIGLRQQGTRVKDSVVSTRT